MTAFVSGPEPSSAMITSVGNDDCRPTFASTTASASGQLYVAMIRETVGFGTVRM